MHASHWRHYNEEWNYHLLNPWKKYVLHCKIGLLFYIGVLWTLHLCLTANFSTTEVDEEMSILKKDISTSSPSEIIKSNNVCYHHRTVVALETIRKRSRVIRKYDWGSSGNRHCKGRVMMSAAVKQPSKIPTKSSSGPGGGNVPSGPALPLASPLMGKKKKPFLGMPAPLGYVPGLGRG